MPSFDATDEGVIAHLDLDEARLLRELVKEMRMLLEADIPRADPVIGRLFPDAYEDAEDAAKFRDMVDDDLRAAKREALSTVSATLGRHGPLDRRLDRGEASSWLTLLTDMRLAIGTRLGVTEEKMERELEPTHPDAAAMMVLHWLGWTQESMLAALTQEG